MVMISAFQSDDLLRLLVVMRSLPADVKKNIQKQNKAVAGPMWKEELQGYTDTRMQAIVLLNTSRVLTSATNVRLQAGNVNRKLSGGMTYKQAAPLVEFGVPDRNEVRGIAGRSRKGKQYTYKRRAMRQFAARKAKGYTAYPAATESIPRFMSLWIQTTIRTIGDSIKSI